MSKEKCVYAGSFDPPTNGHLWMIEKGSEMFDKFIVAVGINPEKRYTFSVSERKEMLEKITQDYPNVEVDSYEDKYLVDYANLVGSKYVLRGIRNTKNFEEERKMNKMNRELRPEIDTIFLVPPRRLSEVSSSMVKGLVGPEGWEAKVGDYLPRVVWEKVLDEFSNLSRRWDGLWERIGAEGDRKGDFIKLVETYSEPHRIYHTLGHIRDCLGELEDVREITEELDKIEMGIWFHDAVYDPRKEYSEENSAELAYKVCRENNLSEEFCEDVRDLVLETKHKKIPEEKDSRIITDIDLSIFGKPPERFDLYERGIRKEYGWVSDEQFREKRIEVLQNFLDRENIYSTEFFREKYEEQAKKNLKRSIERLKGR